MIPHRFQSNFDAGERFSVVNSGELAHVLNNHNLGPLSGDHSRDFKKQVSSGIRKALPVADDAERLARQARKKNVVIRNLVGAKVGNISMRAQAEIFFVNVASPVVYVVGKHASQSERRGSDVEAADAAKQVRKSLQPIRR